MEEGVRWNIKVSKETDLTLRTFLGSQGMKKGDLSKFIEEAVKWRLFDQTVSEVREAFAGVPPDKLQKMIDRAVREVRKEMRQERQSRTER
jgi:ribbon-helix-helix protein